MSISLHVDYALRIRTQEIEFALHHPEHKIVLPSGRFGEFGEFDTVSIHHNRARNTSEPPRRICATVYKELGPDPAVDHPVLCLI